MAKAELRYIRVHDLRHSFASLLIQNGESLAYVKEQMGHHSIKITVDTYGHLEALRKLLDKGLLLLCSPFDKLRANGSGAEIVKDFPFVLSLSKHGHRLVRTVPEF